jgi:hypothetical protein
MTFHWITRIARMSELNCSVLFEGQMRLAFLQESLSSVGLTGARIILVDCDDATRAQRLITERRQPDLANPKMVNWADYLRREAQEANCEVLDTHRRFAKVQRFAGSPVLGVTRSAAGQALRFAAGFVDTKPDPQYPDSCRICGRCRMLSESCQELDEHAHNALF